MSDAGHGRTGVLLVTVWSDGSGPDGVRARLKLAPDVTGEQPAELVVAGADAVLAEVARWLAELTAP
jgi:hypothetical protein